VKNFFKSVLLLGLVFCSVEQVNAVRTREDKGKGLAEGSRKEGRDATVQRMRGESTKRPTKKDKEKKLEKIITLEEFTTEIIGELFVNLFGADGADAIEAALIQFDIDLAKLKPDIRDKTQQSLENFCDIFLASGDLCCVEVLVEKLEEAIRNTCSSENPAKMFSVLGRIQAYVYGRKYGADVRCKVLYFFEELLANIFASFQSEGLKSRPELRQFLPELMKISEKDKKRIGMMTDKNLALDLVIKNWQEVGARWNGLLQASMQEEKDLGVFNFESLLKALTE